MNRLFGRSPSLLLVVAMAMVTATGTVSAANAASSASETVVPAAPSNLAATAVSSTSVYLTWTNNAANQSGVVISLDGEQSVDLQGATVSSYTWNGLSPGTKYWFYIASKIYGTPGDPTGYGNTQSAWVGPVYVTTTPNVTTTPKPQPSPSRPNIKTLPYDNYAGYAAYPSTGYMVNVQATWNVPNISCPLVGVPRAAAWVGMWGGTTSINNNTAWLPQIGTVSMCVNGIASYFAFWEMATLVTGQGNAPQIIDSVPVHPNDIIVASVAFLGPSTFQNGYERRKFELWIHDMTDNKFKLFDEETSAGVQLGSIIRQAGAVIEDEPPSSCSVWDLPDCGVSSPFQWLGHGLARFSPSVYFSNVFVDGGQAGATWKYFKYVMKDGNSGSVLAANSSLALHNSMNYTITWKAQE